MSFPQEPSWKSAPPTNASAAPKNAALKSSDSAATSTPISADGGKTEAVVLTVEQLNREIRSTLEGKFDLVWVQGEISNFKAHTSGHFYLSLKDSKAQIKAVMFRGHNARLKFRPHDGLEVIVRARVTVYEPRGDYQLTLEMMEPVGAGALQKAYEQLKLKLQAEGMFDSKKKRALPAFPRGIALVTSPTGAAIKDMLNILARRNRGIPVTVIPTIVQGEAAAPKIIEALKKAYQLKNIDVIIVGRGGGSMEDLWAFNNEELARTINASPVPIISAVGHEIDFTIADFVADLRAPTPSAAAELVVQNVTELGDRLTRLQRLLGLSMSKSLQNTRNQVSYFRKRLVDPKQILQNLILRNDDLVERLTLATKNFLDRRESRRKILRGRLPSPQQILNAFDKNIQFKVSRIQSLMSQRLLRQDSKLKRAMSMLDTLSPLRTLDRGYAAVFTPDEKGSLVKSVKQVSAQTQIKAQVADGFIIATVISTETNERSPHGL